MNLLPPASFTRAGRIEEAKVRLCGPARASIRTRLNSGTCVRSPSTSSATCGPRAAIGRARDRPRRRRRRAYHLSPVTWPPTPTTRRVRPSITRPPWRGSRTGSRRGSRSGNRPHRHRELPGALARRSSAPSRSTRRPRAPGTASASRSSRSTGRRRLGTRLPKRALEAEPGHALAHLNLGRLANREGRIDEALEGLEAALRSNPRLAEALLLRAQLLRRQAGPAREGRA